MWIQHLLFCMHCYYTILWGSFILLHSIVCECECVKKIFVGIFTFSRDQCKEYSIVKSVINSKHLIFSNTFNMQEKILAFVSKRKAKI